MSAVAGALSSAREYAPAERGELMGRNARVFAEAGAGEREAAAVGEDGLISSYKGVRDAPRRVRI